MDVADTLPRPAGWQALRLIASDIKLAHSVFALPFALLAAFMAASAPGESMAWGRFAGQLSLIVLAMVFARTAAMVANRLVDRHIDARNPRTAGRALPSGKLTTTAGAVALVVSGVLFMLTCAAFGVVYGNWWPAALGLPVLVWITLYGYFKRFTSLCHLYLGSALAISPLAAALALEPVAVAQQPALWLLSFMVLCWVAGFDVIYALQDIDVDRRDRLYSLPARLGTRGALAISRTLHAAAALALASILLVDDRFGVVFGAGVGVVTALLVYEHLTVARWGTSRLAMAFFTLNGAISCVLGGLGIVDLLL